MKHIVLIGMMACGKSTCAARLGQRLNRTVVDTDVCLEQRTGRTIPELFAEKGEAYFRTLERQVVQELARQTDLIIATGGGIPLQEENRIALKKSGVVFWLRRDPVESYRTGSMAGRPLAQEGEKAFVERFRQREPYYAEMADFVVEQGSTPEQAVEEIIHLLSL